MDNRMFLIMVAASAVATPACNPYDKDLGPTPFLCGPTEPQCPRGYACVDDPNTGDEVCTATGPIPSDFDCADDSALEPNDAIDAAWVVPADQLAMFVGDELAICPAGDRDTYAVNLASPNENVELTVSYQDDGAVLRAALLNEHGVSIASAQPVDAMPDTIAAYAQNLPAATYYVQILGPATGTPAMNNYTLMIQVSQ